MTRKRITEQFPWLLPLRITQRKLFFYTAMFFDRNHYAKTLRKPLLPCEIFADSALMLNKNSGFDMKYQYNKVHNLKIAAKKLNGLLIRPGEVFSFWYSERNADKDEPYRDGLSLVNGEITGEYGGGLCQMSNLLYWMFLHSPMTVLERHGHGREAIAPAEGDILAGIDATVAEGWLDLKVKNDTAHTFQLSITFDGERIYGKIYSDAKQCYAYQVFNPKVEYFDEGNGIVEKAQVARRITSCTSGNTREELLYENCCFIDYPLAEGTKITRLQSESKTT